ncbi:hypothetical protein ACRYI5_00995 [Furfurilactobacillus sp. WILCCON 0119]
MIKTNLSPLEEAYNKWWMGRFDAEEYKIISLISYGKKLYEYTTANNRYSDEEDLWCAIYVAKQYGIRVDQVGINGKLFKVSHRMYESVDTSDNLTGGRL